MPPTRSFEPNLGAKSRQQAVVAERVNTTPRRLLPLLVLPTMIGAAVPFVSNPLWPDMDYYTGGIGLYPSPIGTLLGTLGGYSGVRVLNGVAAFVIILLVGLIARELGGRPLLAQALALALIRGEWFERFGMDIPAVAFLAAAVYLYLRGRSTLALVLAAAGAATHLAALPLVIGAILLLGWRRPAVWATAAALAAGGAFVAAQTSYRAAFNLLTDPGALGVGAREAWVMVAPALLLALVGTLERRMALIFAGAVAGAIVSGAIPASVGQWDTRYAAPCVLVAAAGLQLRVLRPAPTPARSESIT